MREVPKPAAHVPNENIRVLVSVRPQFQASREVVSGSFCPFCFC